MDSIELKLNDLEVLIAHSSNKSIAFLLFKENIEILEYHTFIFFDNDISCNSGIVIPDYMNKNEGGICVTTLSNDRGCFILNKKIVLESEERRKSSFPFVFTYRLDVQMMNYLLDYYNGNNKIPEHFISILMLCDNMGIGIDCTPYLLENSTKINNSETESCVMKCYLPFARFCNSGLKNFSPNFPFSDEENRKAKEVIELMKDSSNNDLLIAQKYIYCLLLKTIIISFSSKSQIKKKITELFGFVKEKLGFYIERELVICYWFLKDRNDSRIKRFFKDIQFNSKRNILNTINGMAWDLFHLRYLMTSMYLSDVMKENNDLSNNIISIDSFVTEDIGLSQIVEAYPIKCIIFKKGDIMPKIIWKKSITDVILELDDIEIFYSLLESRINVYRITNLDILIQELEKTLNEIMAQNKR